VAVGGSFLEQVLTLGAGSGVEMAPDRFKGF
jgi:hypothetical protein